jgi:hypothetical protein
MGKIKGWVKIRDDDYMRETKRVGTGFDKRGNKFPHHELNIRWTAFGYVVHGIGQHKPFRSKGEARKAAIKFMKSHPNGLV